MIQEQNRKQILDIKQLPNVDEGIMSRILEKIMNGQTCQKVNEILPDVHLCKQRLRRL